VSIPRWLRSVGVTSRLHSSSQKKANTRRKVVRTLLTTPIPLQHSARLISPYCCSTIDRFEMLIISGLYRFRARRLAFRNDYCFFCAGPCRAVQIRTFDVWHIFWIPLLPLGFWKRWFCTFCGHQPHSPTKTRRPFKWAGFAVLVVLSILFWGAPTSPDFYIGSWISRIGAPIGAVLLLVHLIYTPKELTLKQSLQSIRPADDTVCPFCGTQLILGPRCSCPLCGVVRQ